jgi:hypothetical protein
VQRDCNEMGGERKGGKTRCRYIVFLATSRINLSPTLGLTVLYNLSEI